MPNFQAVITTDREATLQIVEQNIKINEKREIKKLSQEEKNKTILLEKDNFYCPTSLKSKWSYTDQIGSNKNQKLKKDY
jgi:hypothetical protein